MGGVHIIAFVLTTTLALQSGILSGKILNYKLDLLRVRLNQNVIFKPRERALTTSLTQSETNFNYYFYCSAAQGIAVRLAS